MPQASIAEGKRVSKPKDVVLSPLAGVGDRVLALNYRMRGHVDAWEPGEVHRVEATQSRRGDDFWLSYTVLLDRKSKRGLPLRLYTSGIRPDPPKKERKR